MKKKIVVHKSLARPTLTFASENSTEVETFERMKYEEDFGSVYENGQ